jgi:uncharacterized protein YyaL (SSP411 family)
MANALQFESSPYLLQHKDNPINWEAWSPNVLKRALEEDKPILISIGYSACHWCHVMEKESFKDQAVADFMNSNFISIKVDREERPDIDHIYMDALQMMTGQGGWPLNCFALPDGKPFFGGTYFPRERWIETLKTIIDAFKNRRADLVNYANKLTDGLNQLDELPFRNLPPVFTTEAVDVAVSRWSKKLDDKEGGMIGVPKFPMPNNYEFLLHYAHQEGDFTLLNHVKLTARKMAQGGIYDHIGGGFTRYSTDAIWKVPHFEKMLYDNGQLLSFYTNTYLQSNDDALLTTITGIADFLLRDMRAANLSFFAAIDADSEGEEGKFYVWSRTELIAIAGSDFPIIEVVFGIKKEAIWEEDKLIPYLQNSIEKLSVQLQISEEDLTSIINNFKNKAFEIRNKRRHPNTDIKLLVSWNAMAVRGLADAYIATNNHSYLHAAQNAMDWIIELWNKHSVLPHAEKPNQGIIKGYLEDYAHASWAAIRLYEITFNQDYLLFASAITDYVKANFDQNDAGFFYFKSRDDEPLVARKIEINDNVIPSSNSLFSSALFQLSRLYGKSEDAELIKKQLAVLEPQFSHYPSGYSQWMRLMMWQAEPFYEVAIIGENHAALRDELLRHYLPNTILCGGSEEGILPILAHRLKKDKTLIYVCKDGSCNLPVETIEDALGQLAV